MSLLNKINALRNAGIDVDLEYIGGNQVSDRALNFSDFSELEVGNVNINKENFNDGLYVKDFDGREGNGSFFLSEDDLKHFQLK